MVLAFTFISFPSRSQYLSDRACFSRRFYLEFHFPLWGGRQLLPHWPPGGSCFYNAALCFYHTFHILILKESEQTSVNPCVLLPFEANLPLSTNPTGRGRRRGNPPTPSPSCKWIWASIRLANALWFCTVALQMSVLAEKGAV